VPHADSAAVLNGQAAARTSVREDRGHAAGAAVVADRVKDGEAKRALTSPIPAEAGLAAGPAARSWLPRRAGQVLSYLASWPRALHLKLALANRVCGLLPDFFSGPLRARAYRQAGFNVGPGVAIMGNVDMVGGGPEFYDRLILGPYAIVGNHVTINVDEEVRIGRNVSISPYVRIYTGTHQIGPGSNRKLPHVVAKPVVVEDGCWIGLGAMILPGVTVGHGSIVGAGAVVTQDVPPDSYVEGNPARVARKLPWGNR
jgi:maltose O-acetyltransferase